MVNKQTKIVATISSENCATSFLKKLHDIGVDVVRLNTAHQSPEDSSMVVAKVRAASERIAILVDTKGPEMRLLPFADGQALELKQGQIIKFAGASKGFSDSKLVLINYAQIGKYIIKGARILIDDGEIAFTVIANKGGIISAQVESNGKIKGKKSVNVPGANLPLPTLSAKDKLFIDWAIKEKIDFIAHSFVRNHKDILAIQTILDKAKSKIKIIAKIESQEGVDNIDKILDYAHGVMVARGDLGVEIPMEEVPFVQKMLIRKCVERGKPVITATQMLHSMIENPRPTRAEVSDVVNALLDGTDAIMLSGETAYGKYPLNAVKTMSDIALRTDKLKSLVYNTQSRSDKKLADYISKAAVKTAEELGAKEILMSDLSDFSPEMISSYRPSVPVFVKCDNAQRARQLALSYGIYAHHMEPAILTDNLLNKVLAELVRKGKLHPKDLIVYLNSEYNSSLTGNRLEVCQVAKYVKK